MRLSWNGRSKRAPRRGRKQLQRSRANSRRSYLEQLELRQMLSVSLGSLHDIQVPGGQSVLVPLTGVDSLGGPISYSFEVSDLSAPLSLELVSPTSQSLELTVSGTDSNGQAFSDILIFHLFEDLTPTTAARIESLVGDSFYSGKEFFRVLDGFVAQNNGSSGTTFANEIVDSLNFFSPGLLAMANAGTANSNDAQFFVTAIDGAGTTAPITLARMPQFLNSGYTIFGQLVSGFDTFEKMMSTTVENSSIFTNQDGSPEVSHPVNPITITLARIINDTQDAVLRVTSTDADFVNHGVTITVTATNGDNETATQTFGVDVVVNPPTLGPVSNQTTTENTAKNFTLVSRKNDSSVGVDYVVIDPNTFLAPANVTVSIDQSTGVVTLTPDAGFIGTINLLAGVRADSADSDVKSYYDTLPFTLTVTLDSALNPTLGPVSNQETVGTNPVNFTLTSTDTAGVGVAYTVVDADTFAAPTDATVSVDQGTGEVIVTPNSGFTGVLHLLAGVRQAGAEDVQANYNTKAFSITVNSDVVVTPTLGPISDQTTVSDTPVTFTLTSDDPIGDGVFYVVVDPTTFGAPSNVTVGIDQDTGLVTLTPSAGFSGTINLLAGVRSATAEDAQANYNTEAFLLTVTPNIPDAPTGLAVDASSNTGPFDGNGYVTTNTPKLTVNAVSGATVQFKLNGIVIATATETSTGSGVYTATLPAGKLAVGANSITAIATTTGGTSPDSTVLSVTYAPNYSGAAYVVPGSPGTSQQLTITWSAKKAGYNNELGYFIADSINGSIGEISPGSAGYAQAALSSSTRVVLFSKGQSVGASKTITLQAGQMVVFYLIQNNTTANFLAKNPSNTPNGNNKADSPLAFFSIQAANPDAKQHTQIIADATTGRANTTGKTCSIWATATSTMPRSS